MKVFTIYKPYDGSCGRFLNKEDADRVCAAINEDKRLVMEEYGKKFTECDEYHVVESKVFESAEEGVKWLNTHTSFCINPIKLKEK